MAIPAVTADNPLDWDLTFEACLSRSQQPIYTGGTVSVRFQLRDYDDNPVALVGADLLITMEIWFGTTLVTRSSAALISGSTYEIEPDANQVTEVGDTGIGWYECFFLPAETDLVPVVGLRRKYKTKVALSATNVFNPHFKGLIDIGS